MKVAKITEQQLSAHFNNLMEIGKQAFQAIDMLRSLPMSIEADPRPVPPSVNLPHAGQVAPQAHPQAPTPAAASAQHPVPPPHAHAPHVVQPAQPASTAPVAAPAAAQSVPAAPVAPAK
jgi:hypothetical protein